MVTAPRVAAATTMGEGPALAHTQPGHLTYDDQGREEAEGGIPCLAGGIHHLQTGGWAWLISTIISITIFTTSFSAKYSMGSPPSAVGLPHGAQLVELWLTTCANSILATSSTKRGWFAYGTTHRQPGGFAYGTQSAELWFTSSTNSNLATSSTKQGWFAYGTTKQPCGGFAYGTQSVALWFTYSAISSTTTTLVSPPAQPPLHVHLWEVSGRMSWSAFQDVPCLLCRERQHLMIIFGVIL